jgi:hypothetical protein
VRVGVPLVTAALGAAGGVVFGRSKAQRNRTVGPLPIPQKKKIDLGGVAKQVGEAGRQLGKLAREVQAMREKAEQVGRAIS